MLSFVAGVVVGAFVGVLVTLRRVVPIGRGAAVEHEHCWEPWEDCTVRIGADSTVSGQRRRCISCGFKEVRKVFGSS